MKAFFALALLAFSSAALAGGPGGMPPHSIEVLPGAVFIPYMPLPLPKK